MTFASFSENLKRLPPVTHLAALELVDANGHVAAHIPNAPGKIGSLTIYAALAAKYGQIGPDAASEGLALFAEHTQEARKSPGSHPNIDRLLAIIESGVQYQVRHISA